MKKQSKRMKTDLKRFSTREQHETGDKEEVISNKVDVEMKGEFSTSRDAETGLELCSTGEQHDSSEEDATSHKLDKKKKKTEWTWRSRRVKNGLKMCSTREQHETLDKEDAMSNKVDVEMKGEFSTSRHVETGVALSSTEEQHDSRDKEDAISNKLEKKKTSEWFWTPKGSSKPIPVTGALSARLTRSMKRTHERIRLGAMLRIHNRRNPYHKRSTRGLPFFKGALARTKRCRNALAKQN